MEPRISIITLGTHDMARAYEFYHHALGLPTSNKVDDDIYFFKTSGTILAIYPFDKLIEDIDTGLKYAQNGFSGVTLAHNVREKQQVQQILDAAVAGGAKSLKSPQDAFWGGYHCYFSDPDGHIWEVAYWDGWKFNTDGSLVIE